MKHGLEREVFGLEPAANYNKSLGEYLVKKWLRVVFVSGKAITHNREMLDNRWDKNDVKDLANIADLIRSGEIHVLRSSGVAVEGFKPGEDSRRRDGE